jgi:hypothetical protein
LGDLHNEINYLAINFAALMVGFRQMKKSDLANELAKQRGMKSGAAADQMDRVVRNIVRTLRRGRTAHLPGLGTIAPGTPWKFRPSRID